MGRMLEALKHTAEIPPPEPAPEPEGRAEGPEATEDVMPFVEVGGPRNGAAPRPILEVAGPRLASLLVPPPTAVRLQAVPKTAPRVAAELIAYHQPEHEVSRQYSAVFSQMVPETPRDEACVLLLTALAPGAGTTTALLNLAISGCRQQGRQIVIVDANRGRPAVAKRLGLESSAGLHEVFQGTIALEQAVLATPQNDLKVLAAGHAESEGPHWPAEALRWALTWLRQRFDVVFVDGPAWSDTALVRSLCPLVDAVYLVVDATQAQQPLVRAVTRSVMQHGSRVGGLIVTQ
jgi:Mrp family chromosome partitioning ATPase